MLRGLELQHNCNITATRTATQPRNAVIYRVNLPCSMFKGFEPLRKRPCLGKVKNADCVVKNSVAWLCCSSCCSYVAVVLHCKSPRNTVKNNSAGRRSGSCAPLRLPQQVLWQPPPGEEARLRKRCWKQCVLQRCWSPVAVEAQAARLA